MDTSTAGPQRLSPKVITYWRLTGLAGVALFAAVGALATGLAWGGAAAGWVGLALLGIGAVWTWWYASAAYRRWRYEITPTTLELSHGVVFYSESSIPHFRVQHVDIRQGPIERYLGIVKLEISTASSATDAELPGIDASRAEEVRSQVLARTDVADAV